MKAEAYLFEQPVKYADAFDLQKRVHAARMEDRIPDTVLCLQHTPVVTLGRRGRDKHLNVTPTELEARGIEYHLASRGGDITCHGPGQWVLYPIIGLKGAAADTHGYLWKLEEVAIRTAADFGVDAYRREGMNGAWADAGKIAAIGFHIKRWVTIHGMSFNAAAVPEGFGLIVPCGLEGQAVTSLKTVLGADCPAMDAVARQLLSNFAEVCGREIESLERVESVSDDILRDRFGPAARNPG